MSNGCKMVSQMLIFSRFITPISIIKKEKIPSIWLKKITKGNAEYCTATVVETVENIKDNVVDDSRKKKIFPLEKCIQYMKSKAYKNTYGDKPVWHTYIRNFKGNIIPRTRVNCYRGTYLNTASPCPICRDQYLLADYRNIELIKQFISPYGGEILSTMVTGVCQKQQQALVVAIMKAYNYGFLTYKVPQRVYNYSLYNKK